MPPSVRYFSTLLCTIPCGRSQKACILAWSSLWRPSECYILFSPCGELVPEQNCWVKHIDGFMKKKHNSFALTHWDWVLRIYISKQATIVSDNGLSTGQHRAIIWTNAGIFSIGSLWTDIKEILFIIHIFSFKKNGFKNFVWKMAAILSWPHCCLNVLSHRYLVNLISHPRVLWAMKTIFP